MDNISPNFYATLLDNLYDGVYFVNRERQITLWNKAAERITGFTKAEVLGKRCADNLLRHVDAPRQFPVRRGLPPVLYLA